jgi:prepilin-type N-terminal cleavage/methylation domain-containing protein
MRRAGKDGSPRGLTLVELLIGAVILALVSVTAAALLHTCLQAHAYGNRKSALYREGVLAMERMTTGVRNCASLLIPNAHSPSRDVLAFSGSVNDDNDFHFNDPLFPRIDEDLDKDMTNDDKSGIEGEDDDGDGATDEDNKEDDDEDSVKNEDPINGIDNDGDGNIDEDGAADMNGDDKAGMANVDDDGDGAADEGDKEDDDEDGTKNEDPLNPIVYYVLGGNELREKPPPDPPGSDPGPGAVLSERVTGFTVTYEPPDTDHDPRISISLTLTDADGESVTFFEYVYPRNIVQKTGKKVR